jgi:hypothetical protein
MHFCNFKIGIILKFIMYLCIRSFDQVFGSEENREEILSIPETAAQSSASSPDTRRVSKRKPTMELFAPIPQSGEPEASDPPQLDMDIEIDEEKSPSPIQSCDGDGESKVSTRRRRKGRGLGVKPKVQNKKPPKKVGAKRGQQVLIDGKMEKVPLLDTDFRNRARDLVRNDKAFVVEK